MREIGKAKPAQAATGAGGEIGGGDCSSCSRDLPASKRDFEATAATPPRRPPRGRSTRDWRDQLQISRTGAYRAHEHNAGIALRYAPELRGRLRWNEMLAAIEARDLPWDDRNPECWRPWGGSDVGCLAEHLQAEGLNVGPRVCETAALVVARETCVRPEGRDVITLRPGERDKALLEAERILRDLALTEVGWLFDRGRASVVLRVALQTAKLSIAGAEVELPAGSAYLAPAKPEHVARLLDRAAGFRQVKRNSKGGEHEVAVDCSVEFAKHVLANADLLPIRGIARAPVLRADGSVLERAGYDPATALFFAPETTFPTVSERPTQKDARAAYARLCRPFRGFPFATEADLAAVVAEVLTLVSRHLVPRAPAFLHNATEAASGKTKLFETVSIIALGSGAPLESAEVLEDDAELRKQLLGRTIAASPLLVLDNVERGQTIKSPVLAQFLTATIHTGRPLGGNETVEAPTTTVIGLTGNAPQIAGDLTRRIIRIDIDPRCERPELRDLGFDCEIEAQAERGELVAAALTILRAHALAGRPPVPGRAVLGSFEDWDRIVCGALVFAGAPDILNLLDKTRTVDPERARLSKVLRVLAGVGCDRNFMKASAIVRAVEAALAGRQRSGIDEAVDQAAEWADIFGQFAGKDGKPNAVRLGRYLAANARVVDGMALLVRWDGHAKANEFRVEVHKPKRENGRTEAETLANAELSAADTGRGLSPPRSRFAGDAGGCGYPDLEPEGLSKGKANPVTECGTDLNCLRDHPQPPHGRHSHTLRSRPNPALDDEGVPL